MRLLNTREAADYLNEKKLTINGEIFTPKAIRELREKEVFYALQKPGGHIVITQGDLDRYVEKLEKNSENPSAQETTNDDSARSSLQRQFDRAREIRRRLGKQSRFFEIYTDWLPVFVLPVIFLAFYGLFTITPGILVVTEDKSMILGLGIGATLLIPLMAAIASVLVTYLMWLLLDKLSGVSVAFEKLTATGSGAVFFVVFFVIIGFVYDHAEKLVEQSAAVTSANNALQKTKDELNDLSNASRKLLEDNPRLLTTSKNYESLMGALPQFFKSENIRAPVQLSLRIKCYGLDRREEFTYEMTTQQFDGSNMPGDGSSDQGVAIIELPRREGNIQFYDMEDSAKGVIGSIEFDTSSIFNPEIELQLRNSDLCDSTILSSISAKDLENELRSFREKLTVGPGELSRKAIVLADRIDVEPTPLKYFRLCELLLEASMRSDQAAELALEVLSVLDSGWGSEDTSLWLARLKSAANPSRSRVSRIYSAMDNARGSYHHKCSIPDRFGQPGEWNSRFQCLATISPEHTSLVSEPLLHFEKGLAGLYSAFLPDLSIDSEIAKVAAENFGRSIDTYRTLRNQLVDNEVRLFSDAVVLGFIAETLAGRDLSAQNFLALFERDEEGNEANSPGTLDSAVDIASVLRLLDIDGDSEHGARGLVQLFLRLSDDSEAPLSTRLTTLRDELSVHQTTGYELLSHLTFDDADKARVEEERIKSLVTSNTSLLQQHPYLSEVDSIRTIEVPKTTDQTDHPDLFHVKIVPPSNYRLNFNAACELRLLLKDADNDATFEVTGPLTKECEQENTV